HEGYHPAEDFRHAAAQARRIDMDDALALEPRGQLPKPLHLCRSHDLFVAIKKFHVLDPTPGFLANGQVQAVAFKRTCGSLKYSRKTSINSWRSWLRLRK